MQVSLQRSTRNPPRCTFFTANLFKSENRRQGKLRIFGKLGSRLNVIDVTRSRGLITNAMAGVTDGLCVVVECPVFYFVWSHRRNSPSSVGHGWMWDGSIEDILPLKALAEWMNSASRCWGLIHQSILVVNLIEMQSNLYLKITFSRSTDVWAGRIVFYLRTFGGGSGGAFPNRSEAKDRWCLTKFLITRIHFRA